MKDMAYSTVLGEPPAATHAVYGPMLVDAPSLMYGVTVDGDGTAYYVTRARSPRRASRPLRRWALAGLGCLAAGCGLAVGGYVWSAHQRERGRLAAWRGQEYW